MSKKKKDKRWTMTAIFNSIIFEYVSTWIDISEYITNNGNTDGYTFSNIDTNYFITFI